jgi:hypothetical protein
MQSTLTKPLIQSDAAARNFLDNLGISELLARDGLTEIMINRPHELFIEGSFGVERIENPNLSLDQLHQLANALANFNSKHINAANPIHSVTLPDGERGHIMLPPSCEDKTAVFAIRKPSTSRFSLGDYIKTNRLQAFVDYSEHGKAEDFRQHQKQPENPAEAASETTQEALHQNSRHFADIADQMKLPHDVPLADWQYQMLEAKANRDLNTFFQIAIDRKLNICMVGGTGSGKTTFTKSLVDLIPSDTRLITIEDTHELDTPNHPNHAHLFYKEHITAKQIIAACMRLKPDRILLTELRGDEAWDYLSALNTGHPGGLTSVHANDARSVHYRIAQLAMESAAGKSMPYEYILNTVRATIDVVCFFKHTYMTELYYDPVATYYALRGRA